MSYAIQHTNNTRQRVFATVLLEHVQSEWMSLLALIAVTKHMNINAKLLRVFTYVTYHWCTMNGPHGRRRGVCCFCGRSFMQKGCIHFLHLTLRVIDWRRNGNVWHGSLFLGFFFRQVFFQIWVGDSLGFLRVIFGYAGFFSGFLRVCFGFFSGVFLGVFLGFFWGFFWGFFGVFLGFFSGFFFGFFLVFFVLGCAGFPWGFFGYFWNFFGGFWGVLGVFTGYYMGFIFGGFGAFLGGLLGGFGFYFEGEFAWKKHL